MELISFDFGDPKLLNCKTPWSWHLCPPPWRPPPSPQWGHTNPEPGGFQTKENRILFEGWSFGKSFAKFLSSDLLYEKKRGKTCLFKDMFRGMCDRPTTWYFSWICFIKHLEHIIKKNNPPKSWVLSGKFMARQTQPALGWPVLVRMASAKMRIKIIPTSHQRLCTRLTGGTYRWHVGWYLQF